MTHVPYFHLDSFPSWAPRLARSYHDRYYAMYSSVLGGIVTDPRLMVVPVDDHLVHRGDGVFETCKCVDGRLYNLRAHLDRLCQSAKGLALAVPGTIDELTDVVVQTVRAGGRENALVRILLARGPGSMGVDPYDCPEPALYVVAYELKKPFMERHPGGAKLKSSHLPVKPPPFATIKSANYLYNVLMRKEAADAGADFVAAFDADGHLAEGATENLGIVTREGVLQVPKPANILAGTTMLRVLQLARAVVREHLLLAAEHADISKEDMAAALEILVFGTTPDVTAVVEFDGRPVGDGKTGHVFQRLSDLLLDDIYNNVALHTPVF